MNLLLNTGLFLIFTQFFVPPICENALVPYTPYGYYEQNHGCTIAQKYNLNFTIHGLWPEFTNDTYPEYCNKSAVFDIDKLDSIEDYLGMYWVSYEGMDSTFWEHEFMKHETCYPNTTELDYFTNGLKLYKFLDTNTKMSDINRGTYYNKESVMDYFGGVFQCGNHYNYDFRQNYNNHLASQVVQFWTCWDFSFNKITCPEWLDNSCGSMIVF